MNNWGILQALLFEPRKAFAEIHARPRFWVPLLAIVAGSLLINVWYQGVVDAEWFTDMQLRASSISQSLTEEQIEQRVKAAAANPGLRVAITGIATTLAVVLFTLLSALYLLLAGKITNVQAGFRQWLALGCWTGLPALLAVIPAAINLATATTTQIEPIAMAPLSLNALFFHRGMGDPGYTVLTSLNVTTFLALFLCTWGVKEWSRRSWLFATVFVTLPYVVIFGIWGYFSLGRS